MLKRAITKANIPVIYLKEGRTFICYSPAFDLAVHGDSFEDAARSFARSLKLFAEQVSRKGSWKEILQEYGWVKVKEEWNPPRVIGQESKEIEIATGV